MKKVKGYKVFNSDWTCRGKQYTCPGKFEEDVNLKVCRAGMHFCKQAIDCFHYYTFNSDNKVAEVIAYGDVVENDDKCCTNKLEVVREIPWAELLNIVNTGDRNGGCGNTGDRNSGHFNSGDRNSGYFNSGNFNSGDGNSGNGNSGHYNTGDRNSGCGNSGNGNSGYYNTGNFNSGDYNSGNFNSGDGNSGCFNTINAKIYLFNKPSDWTHKNWENSTARKILAHMPEENATEWWDSLSAKDKATVKAIPNFDAEIFKEITGIEVNE